ncbi:transcription cofactor vestigial-like protein 1 [Pelobates fuscus]|uniref:transcription cofactor vestigial-like protein 1 n=1 Tax=Pelobates fuscus TaxID=191477 RepID=UPI002FE49748
MEDLRKSPSEYKNKDHPVKTELGSRCVVFTYYQGDINSVVDEHFSRALRTTKDPQDLRTKTRSDDYLQKNMSNMQPDEMDWNKAYSSNPSIRMAGPVLTALGSPSVDHYPVFQGHHTPPSDLYHYHHMGPASQMSSVYHHPSVSEFQMVQGTGPDGKYGSLLSLLQPDRYPIPLQESVMKPEPISATATGPSGSESLNHRMNSQAGLHPQERRKEFFHPQDRRKDLYFY